MGNRVQRVRTPVSEPQMAQAVIRGWNDLFGSTPTKEQVAIIMSQNALETGNRKSMWNFNVGNITTSGKDVYDFFDDLPTDEQVKPGKWVKMNLKYRAYPTLEAGVKDYLKFIKNRYSAAWNNIVNPDPAAFSKSLKQKGYYTANEAPYTKSLSKLYNKFNTSDSYHLAINNKVPTSNIRMLSQQPKKNVETVLDNYIKMIAATEKVNKKLYKQYLPYNKAVIVVKSDNVVDSIEFSRVLCSVIEEELLAQAHTHTDGLNVEIECSIPGPSEECFNVLQHLTDVTAEAFKTVTKKIGSVVINNYIISNKRSSYQPITFKMADSQYRRFLLKFI